VTYTNFHTEDPQILGNTLKKFSRYDDMVPGICASLNKYMEQFEISYPVILSTFKLQFYKLYCCNVPVQVAERSKA
jgi:hypothetical protein